MTSLPIQVYLCCAAEDEAPHGRALYAQLRGFLRPEVLALHRQVQPGADMRAEITERLTQAAVVVVLDSPALRTDPEYLALVVPHLQRRRALGLPILSVRLRAVATEPCLEGLTQLLDLLLLAPDLQQAVLCLEAVDGSEPMAERTLRAVAHAGSWVEQRGAWARLASYV